MTSFPRKRSLSMRVSTFNDGNELNEHWAASSYCSLTQGRTLRNRTATSIGEREAVRLAKDLPFLARPGTWRLQINLIPVPAAHAQDLRPRLAHLPMSTVLPL